MQTTVFSKRNPILISNYDRRAYWGAFVTSFLKRESQVTPSYPIRGTKYQSTESQSVPPDYLNSGVPGFSLIAKKLTGFNEYTMTTALRCVTKDQNVRQERHF